MPDDQTPEHWDERYRSDNTPWEMGAPSPELLRVLQEEGIEAGAALDLGCGRGWSCIELARRGFQVTGVDVSNEALTAARKQARETGVQVDFQQADLLSGVDLGGPYDFVFDRGCFHTVRRADARPYLASLAAATRAGARMLLLAGNADEPLESGPPTVTAAELTADLEPLFQLQWLRRLRFGCVMPESGLEPLGWSLFLKRR